MKMLRKQNLWAATLRNSMLITAVILITPVFCSVSHAIGPYQAGAKTLVDLGTGLEWQKSDKGTLHTWQSALSHCEQLSLNGENDWRVPNIRELKSLVDYNRYYPAVDPAISCQSSIYWSATTVANDSHLSAWTIFFGNGDDIWKLKTERHHVRCVRSGPVEK